jgi:S-DNA-T family DNA segregation ATPase FtsK/SpoIIIE
MTTETAPSGDAPADPLPVADTPPADGVPVVSPAGPLARELREQARAVGDRLKESLDGQVTGRVVRGVGRLLRHFGNRAGPALVASPADGQDEGSGAAAPAAAVAPRRAPRAAPDVDHLLAQFRQRRQAREDRRAQRQVERGAAAPAAAVPPEPQSAAPLAAPTAPVPPPPPVPTAPASAPDTAPPPTVPAPAPPPPPPSGSYTLPALGLLAADDTTVAADPEEIGRNRRIIQETLDSFGIDAEVGHAIRGPRVTLYEVSVSPGVKVEAISHIANNLAMELAAVSLRILAPVPGQDRVGIEVPNQVAETVRLGSLLRGDPWARSTAEVPLMLGRSIHGTEVILDLAKAPHLLVAGATGSGKSVCLNGILLSLLYRFRPHELRLILVDPKVVEFAVYRNLPHLLLPVINDVGTVVLALRWLIHEMERRYRLLAKVGARHLQGFNRRPPETVPVLGDDGVPVPPHLPIIVLVIDELADIILTARHDVETSLARLAQMSRAVGIHTVLATQRPSVNIITGIIKANFPTRVAFQVSSQVDSRTIIDFKGAESLLGRGDMLFKPPGVARLQRLQGPLVEDADIEAVAAFVSAQGTAPADFGLLAAAAADGASPGGGEAAAEEVDAALLQEAMEIVRRDRRASTSYLQRRLRLGYNRAAAIMDCLEQRGIIGPNLGAGPREILCDAPMAVSADADGETA